MKEKRVTLYLSQFIVVAVLLTCLGGCTKKPALLVDQVYFNIAQKLEVNEKVSLDEVETSLQDVDYVESTLEGSKLDFTTYMLDLEDESLAVGYNQAGVVETVSYTLPTVHLSYDKEEHTNGFSISVSSTDYKQYKEFESVLALESSKALETYDELIELFNSEEVLMIEAVEPILDVKPSYSDSEFYVFTLDETTQEGVMFSLNQDDEIFSMSYLQSIDSISSTLLKVANKYNVEHDKQEIRYELISLNESLSSQKEIIEYLKEN